MPTDQQKKTRRRKLIVLESYTAGTGEDQTFGCKAKLPLGSATKDESEQAAIRIMAMVNDQLEFVGSDLRLTLWDVVQNRHMVVRREGPASKLSVNVQRPEEPPPEAHKKPAGEEGRGGTFFGGTAGRTCCTRSCATIKPPKRERPRRLPGGVAKSNKL